MIWGTVCELNKFGEHLRYLRNTWRRWKSRCACQAVSKGTGRKRTQSVVAGWNREDAGVKVPRGLWVWGKWLLLDPNQREDKSVSHTIRWLPSLHAGTS